MQRQKHIFDCALVIIFAVMLILPLAVMPLVGERQISEREQRRLAAWPQVELSGESLQKFPEEFAGWYKDHFGFRDQLTALTARFKEKVFAKSLARHIVVGKHGWRFMSIDGSLRDYVGDYTPDGATLEKWQLGLEIKRDWLESLGIRYLLVPLLSKAMVYPEFLPNRFANLRAVTRLDGFMHSIKDSPLQQVVLDTPTLFAARKSGRPLYFKQDTHWNDDGAFLVYQATVDKLSQWFPELQPVSPSNLQRSPESRFGDIARASGLSLATSEIAEKLTVLNPCANDQYRAVEHFALTDAYKRYPKKLPVLNGCPAATRKAVVVHDSFGVYLYKYLSEQFSEVIFMSSYDVYGMKSFLTTFQPDVFIDFRVDRRFHKLLEIDPAMAEELQPWPERG